MNSSNPAQSVKAVEWEGKASITFDWKRGGLVIELEGRGKVTTEFDQVQVAIPDDPLWTDKDEQRIKDYKVTPEEQAAFDSGKPFSIDTATGQVIEPTNLYHELGRRVVEFFRSTAAVEVEAEVITDPTKESYVLFKFRRNRIGQETREAIKAIMGVVNFDTLDNLGAPWAMIGDATEPTSVEQQVAEADRDAFNGLEESSDAPQE